MNICTIRKNIYIFQVVGTYSCRRRACRWPLAIFFNMLDVSAYNAFVLWTAVDPSWNQNKTFKWRLFLEELGKMLVSPQMQRRQHLPRAPSAATMVADLQHWTAPVEIEIQDCATNSNKRRRLCDYCTGKRKKIATTCFKCGKYICKTHTSQYCISCSHELN